MKKRSSGLIALPKSSVFQSKSVQDYFRLGITNFNRGNYKGSNTFFTWIIEKEPNNSMAYYYRGMAKIYLRDTRGAINDLTIACSIPLLAKGGCFSGVANLPQ